MNFHERLGELRAKPENIRIRYMWALIFVSMFFILLIWTVSLKQKIGVIITKSKPENQKAEEVIKSVDKIMDSKNQIKGQIGNPENLSN